MKQHRAIESLYLKKDRDNNNRSSGGFLSGKFHLSRKDWVIFRFFGRVRTTTIILDCPACGEVPAFSDTQCRCANPECMLYGRIFTRTSWNEKRQKKESNAEFLLRINEKTKDIE